MSGQTSRPPTARSAALAQDLRGVVGKVNRRLREQTNVGELSSTQGSVLFRINREAPVTTSRLARAEGMRPQSMRTVIAALEAAGLVTGTPDSNDGRQTLISLTAAGDAWIHEGRAARQDWLARAIQTRLTGQEQEGLKAGIELLKRLFED